MSKRDNFAGGFFLGTIVGGLVGGVVGIVLGSRTDESLKETEDSPPDYTSNRDHHSSLGSETDYNLTLEAKIAQLNTAIDDMRQRLNIVHNDQEINK